MFKLIKFLFRLVLLIVIVGLALFLYSKYIEPNMLQVKDVEISSPMISEEADQIRVAVFGDTHFGDFYDTEDFDKVLNAINEMKPDIVVFTGDLIDHYDTFTKDVSAISEKLAQIEAPLGKFAIFGNHDYGGGAEYEYQSIMENGGFMVLKNDYYGLNELQIGIIGIDDVLIGYGDPQVASWGRPDYFNLILAHEPDIVDEILDYNVDLLIAGHTHGRQINLKFFDEYVLPPYGKKYISGTFEFDNDRNSRLYVNSGIGMTKLPLRFLSPPELTCITLRTDIP